MIIFAADDPLVLDGTYDIEGYTPGERARIATAHARQHSEAPMATRKRKTNGSTGGRRGHAQPARPAREPKKRKSPRQPDLPGTEDRSIAELEVAAHEYADVRDSRMALNEEEVGLKAKLLRLMKVHGKTSYHRDGISIEVVSEEETVKVRVKKPADDDDQADDAPDTAEAEA